MSESPIELRRKENLERMLKDAEAYMPGQSGLSLWRSQGEQVQDDAAQADAVHMLPDEATLMSVKEDYEKIVEAMRTDEAAALSLRAQYPKLYDEAQRRNERMEHVANLGSLEKVKEGVSYSERSDAKAERDKMRERKETLQHQREVELAHSRAYYNEQLGASVTGRTDEWNANIIHPKQGIKHEARLQAIQDESFVDAENLYASAYANEIQSVSLLKWIQASAETGERVLRLKTARMLAEKKLQNPDPGHTKIRLKDVWQDARQNSFFMDGLAMLNMEGNLTEEELSDRIVSMVRNLVCLKQADPNAQDPEEGIDSTEEEQKASLVGIMDVLEMNYNMLGSIVAGKPKLFAGSIHPDTLLSKVKNNGLNQAKPVQKDPDAVQQLYELKRRCSFAKTLLKMTDDFAYVKKLKAGNPTSGFGREFLDACESYQTYLDSMEEYLGGIFTSLEKWEAVIGGKAAGPLDYTSEGFTDILKRRKGQAVDS